MPFSYNFWRVVLVYSLGKYTRFGYSPPVSVGVGSKLAKFAVFLVAKILKMHIF